MADPTLREHSPLKCGAIEHTKRTLSWGQQDHSDLRWLLILLEEVGKVGKTINKTYPNKACIDNLKYELIKITAICMGWVECIRRREQTVSKTEENKKLRRKQQRKPS